MFRVSVTIEVGRTGQGEPQTRELQLLTRESWKRVKGLVKKRDHATCHICKRYAPGGQVDHVIPLSRGGTDALDNLAWACVTCNRSKGSKTLQEYTSQEYIPVDVDGECPELREADPNDPVIRRIMEDVQIGWESGAGTDNGDFVMPTDVTPPYDPDRVVIA